jgi:hypothetical protein
MATIVKDAEFILSLPRVVEGELQVIKHYFPTNSSLHAMSFPEEELTEKERAKIVGPATADGWLHFLIVTPWFNYSMEDSIVSPNVYIWLESGEEAAHLNDQLRTL